MKCFSSHIYKKVLGKRFLVCSFYLQEETSFSGNTRYWKPFVQLEEVILELRHGFKFRLKSKLIIKPFK